MVKDSTGFNFLGGNFGQFQLPFPATAFRWYLKLKCNSCGEVPEHWQYISQEERVPVKARKMRYSDWGMGNGHLNLKRDRAEIELKWGRDKRREEKENLVREKEDEIISA